MEAKAAGQVLELLYEEWLKYKDDLDMRFTDLLIANTMGSAYCGCYHTFEW